VLLKVAAVGQRMPAWVSTAWQEYARRFPRNIQLDLIEIAMPRRGKNPDIERIRNAEGIGLLSAVSGDNFRIALDIEGKRWTTADLARELEKWLAGGRNVGLMIGGPDGLAEACLEGADARWSLGPLTLPHTLCRVVVAEQLYRAWSVVNNHPYHRE